MTTPDAITLVREALEHAPRVGVSTAPGLEGVLLDGVEPRAFVCAKCIGRLMGRGCGHLVRGSHRWTPIIFDLDHERPAQPCDACGGAA